MKLATKAVMTHIQIYIIISNKPAFHHFLTEEAHCIKKRLMCIYIYLYIYILFRILCMICLYL